MFWSSSVTYSAGLSKMHCERLVEQFIFFLKKKLLLHNHFRKMSEPVSDFWPTNFWQSCQNCIVGVQRNKSRKNILLKEKHKYVKIFSGIERKMYRLFCQICILRTKTNFFSKNIFHEKL